MLKKILILLLLAVNLMLAYQLYSGPGSITAYLENRAAYEELQKQNRHVVSENKLLSTQIKHLRQNETYIEDAVRKEMNYVREDEVIYFFPE